MRVTLCGSTRFKKEFQDYNTQLSIAGHIVYSIAWAKEDESASAPGVKMDVLTKQNLDLVHMSKILNSDAIVIVSDGSNYVGDSTRREIVWAQMQGKYVSWGLEDFLAYFIPPTQINIRGLK